MKHLLRTSVFSLFAAYSSSLGAMEAGDEKAWHDEFLDLGKGSSFYVYKQDPSVYDTTAIGSIMKQPLIKQVYINRKVAAGPQDADMEVVSNKISPNSEGDFTSVKEGTLEFDSAHTYAVARQVYDMWRGTIDTIKQEHEASSDFQRIERHWDARDYGILKINAHAGTDVKNAYYFRNGKVRKLNFFDFNNGEGKTICTARSSDVVAHETGHAILDIIQPGYYDTSKLQTGGLHEAFGDITSLFFILNQDDLAENLLVSTKGNLHLPNFASFLAEEFGQAKGLLSLRDADNDYTLNQVEQDAHEVSQVFTGAVYDSFVRGFNDACKIMRGQHRLTQVLQDTAGYYRRLLLHSIINDTSGAPSFRNIANTMIDLSVSYAKTSNHYLKDLPWKAYIDEEFARRDILIESHVAPLKPEAKIGRKVGICGTLSHKYISHQAE